MRTLAAISLVLFLVPAPAAAQPFASETRPAPVAGGPRVRPYDSRSAATLLQGLERSATMRAIVEAIEQRDVIVYLQMQPALKRGIAGTLTWLTAGGGFRYVRISLNPEVMADLAIATLAHELQHALEVAQEPSIVSAATLEAHYRTHGISVSSHIDGWDTQAARTTGQEVRKELLRADADGSGAAVDAGAQASWHAVYQRAREQFLQ